MRTGECLKDRIPMGITALRLLLSVSGPYPAADVNLWGSLEEFEKTGEDMRSARTGRDVTFLVEKCVYRGRDSNSYDLCDRGILRFRDARRQINIRIRSVSGKTTFTVPLPYFSSTILIVFE